MTFKKGVTPPGAKPFVKGQSGNPKGRPKTSAELEAWRRQNSSRLPDLLTPEDIDGALLRWWARFCAGDPKALWIKDEILLPPPKPAEPEKDAETRVEQIVIKRFEKRPDAEDGDD